MSKTTRNNIIIFFEKLIIALLISIAFYLLVLYPIGNVLLDRLFPPCVGEMCAYLGISIATPSQKILASIIGLFIYYPTAILFWMLVWFKILGRYIAYEK